MRNDEDLVSFPPSTQKRVEGGKDAIKAKIYCCIENVVMYMCIVINEAFGIRR